MTFGRRQTPSASLRLHTRPGMSPMPALNSRAEAFRAEVADRSGIPSSFDQWRRSRSGRRWLVFAVTLASFSPGLASFLIDAPIGVSIGLGGAAFVANVWLRRERRRRLQAIVAWEEPADAG